MAVVIQLAAHLRHLQLAGRGFSVLSRRTMKISLVAFRPFDHAYYFFIHHLN